MSVLFSFFFFFKQKTAYEMRISDWSSDVCSSDLAQIEAQLARTPDSDAAFVPMCHALARELEDLGRHAASFAALKRGADARRRRLQYRVEADLDTMRLIADTFVTDFFAAPHAGHDDARPLFVIGLPRSGTTLVDRILSSHLSVTSRGES